MQPASLSKEVVAWHRSKVTLEVSSSEVTLPAEHLQSCCLRAEQHLLVYRGHC